MLSVFNPPRYPHINQGIASEGPRIIGNSIIARGEYFLFPDTAQLALMELFCVRKCDSFRRQSAYNAPKRTVLSGNYYGIVVLWDQRNSVNISDNSVIHSSMDRSEKNYAWSPSILPCVTKKSRELR